ncbi:MAG: hypothetical protein HEEMFOPI_01641 [Holosporales bacterium]
MKNIKMVNEFSLFNQQKNLYECTLVLLPQLKNIVKYLSSIGVQHFSYYSLTNDDKAFYICTHDEFNKMHYQNSYGFDGMGRSAYVSEHFGLQKLLFFGDPNHQMYAPNKPMNGQLMFNLNLWNSLSFYEKTINGFESFNFFGNNENENMINIFSNHENLLRLFILFFKENFLYITKDIPKNYLLHVIKDTTFDPTISSQTRPTQKLIFNDVNVPITFTLNEGEITLSPQQSKILYFLAQGIPIKCIADRLKITENAVRQYLIKIKIKTGLKNQNELLYVFNKTNSASFSF